MKKNNARKGFTLIELMIVVAIIGILAAIAIPNFIRYQLRSKTTEAKVILGGVKTSEESFRAEYDSYATLVTNPGTAPGTTKGDWDSTACPAACSRLAPSSCTEFACVGYEPSGQVYYQYAVSTTPASTGTPAEFSAGAVADLDGDSNSGSFTLRTANAVGSAASSLPDGVSTCDTTSIPAGEVFDCAPNVY